VAFTLPGWLSHCLGGFHTAWVAFTLPGWLSHCLGGFHTAWVVCTPSVWLAHRLWLIRTPLVGDFTPSIKTFEVPNKKYEVGKQSACSVLLSTCSICQKARNLFFWNVVWLTLCLLLSASFRASAGATHSLSSGFIVTTFSLQNAGRPILGRLDKSAAQVSASKQWYSRVTWLTDVVVMNILLLEFAPSKPCLHILMLILLHFIPSLFTSVKPCNLLVTVVANFVCWNKRSCCTYTSLFECLVRKINYWFYVALLQPEIPLLFGCPYSP